MPGVDSWYPTAQQSFAAAHRAPRSPCWTGSAVPAGFGVVTTYQRFPFQCSASFSSAPEAGSRCPTAQQSRAEKHVAAMNASSPVDDGGVWSGTVTFAQALPFQCSIAFCEVRVGDCTP